MKNYQNEQGQVTERRTVTDLIMDGGVRAHLFRNPEDRTRIVNVEGYKEGSATGIIQAQLYRVDQNTGKYHETREETNLRALLEDYFVEATNEELALLKGGSLISKLVPAK